MTVNNTRDICTYNSLRHLHTILVENGWKENWLQP